MFAPMSLINRRRQTAFTLVELMVAIAIVGLLLAATVPASMRFYESIQYRQAVRDVLGTLSAARQQAMDFGRPRDVLINTQQARVSLGDDSVYLPDGFTLSVTSASEVNRDALAVIRFYPEGSSSGGDIDIRSPAGQGVRVSVDWLMGGIEQARYDHE